MNIFGWIFIILSWVAILSFNVYCFYKVLKSPEEDL